jgi:DNA-binding NarL/FixJ family response regulator
MDDRLPRERKELERELLQELRTAELAYRSARTETQKILKRYQDLPLGHPDGSHARQQAVVLQHQALAKYSAAVKAFATLVTSVSAPVVDPQSNSKPVETLTRREKQVLLLIAQDLSTKEIAQRLGITFKTAACHRSRIMEKLELHSVVGLVRYAIREKLIEA